MTTITETDWTSAREQWAKVEGEAARIRANLEGAGLAFTMSRSSSQNDRVPEHLKQLAEPFLHLDEIEIQNKINQYAEEQLLNREIVRAERERYEHARRQETNRRALQLQPAHRKAVRKIAKAVEDLSSAIKAERSIRSQCRPEPTSKYLPDCSSVLCCGTLEEENSRLRTWREEMKKLGV